MAAVHLVLMQALELELQVLLAWQERKLVSAVLVLERLAWMVLVLVPPAQALEWELEPE